MGQVTKSIRGWGSPSRYFQGPGLLKKLETYTSKFGDNAFAIIDQFFFETFSRQLKSNFEGTGSNISTQIFDSEVTAGRIEKAAKEAKKKEPDVIVGIGGGKTIDTAKAVADLCRSALIIIPTSASTDAPTIALSVLYSEEHEHLCARPYERNPDIVLVDSEIIANAPVRFLVSGMGDALSTVFEARANRLSDSNNYISGGYRRTKTGFYIAEECYKMLIANGMKALEAAKKHVVTESLEDIIEVNTLMSGIGVENNGCSGAHSICEGISALPADSKTFHGEKVGFGVICQLVAENAPLCLLEEVLTFCINVGLPVTLDDLYIENTEENIRAIAELSMGSYWDTEPFFIDVDAVCAAISEADGLGKLYKEKLSAGQPYTKSR